MLAPLPHAIAAAFFWRPAGLPIAPNLVALGLVVAAGFWHPAFWAAGAPVEVGYLLILGSNRRFRMSVGRQRLAASADPVERKKATLPEEELGRFQALEARCRAFLRPDHPALADALGHLLRAYLELMVTQEKIRAVAEDSASTRELQARLRSLRDRLVHPELSDELRQSLQSQLQLVETRLGLWQGARDKLDLITAELRRIEDHVELLREQELLSVDPVPASQRIDAIADALRSTDQWLAEQRVLLDLPAENPAPIRLQGGG